MADQPGTLEQIGLALAKLLQPLQELAGDGDPVRALDRFGIRLPGAAGTDPALSAALTYIVSAAGRLDPSVTKLTNAIDAGDASQIVPAGVELVGVIADVVHAITGVADALGTVGAGSGLTGPDLTELQHIADTLPKRIFDLLLVELLRSKGPNILPALTVLGVVDDAIDPGTPGNAARPPFRRRAVHFDRLLDLLTNPVQYLDHAFGFGQPTFDGSLLFAPLKQFLDDIDFPGVDHRGRGPTDRVRSLPVPLEHGPDRVAAAAHRAVALRGDDRRRADVLARAAMVGFDRRQGALRRRHRSCGRAAVRGRPHAPDGQRDR